MQTVIIVIHLMIVSAMIGLVLLQKSEGGGLGMGGGGGGFLTSRGTSNVLTRTTAILAAAFFVTSLCSRSWPASTASRARSCRRNPGGADLAAGRAGRDRADGPGGMLDRLKGGAPEPPRSQ